MTSYTSKHWPAYVTIFVSGLAGGFVGYVRVSMHLSFLASTVLSILAFLPAIGISFGCIWLQDRLQRK